MNPKMKDYLMRRMDRNRTREDGRNPYGSRGGYVRGHRMYDGRMDRNSYYTGEFHGMSDRRMDSGMEYDDMRRSRYHGDMRHERDYGDIREYDRCEEDHARYDINDYGGGYLNRQELEAWKSMLFDDMEKSERDMFAEDKILKKAKDTGVKYEKFTEDEFVVTVLMLYSDYGKTLGKANIDTYIKMACDFLCDKDAGVQGGEKLTAYFDHVVNV